MIFKTPWILFLIPLAVIGLLIYQNNRKLPAFLFPSKSLAQGLTTSWRIQLSFLPSLIRLVVLSLFLVALAGPRSVKEETVYESEGIDIVLAIDSSGSMVAEDFTINGKRLNRLEVVKSVVKDFVEQRNNDRIGLVTFAALAYTVCPLTTDYRWINDNLDRVELGMIADGTAVGSGIASSITRLNKSDAKSKIIILLTDGVNNVHEMEPLDAARIAKSFGIKVYTIGAGSKGYAPVPIATRYGKKIYRKYLIDIDEDTLKEIADITGAKYFRATDTESLRQIYQEIDKLETTKIEQYGYKEYTELFNLFLMTGLILLMFDILLRNTLFLRIP